MTCSLATSLSRRIVTVVPSTEISPAKVACAMPSRSATIEGMTDISASVEDIPVRTRSNPT